MRTPDWVAPVVWVIIALEMIALYILTLGII